MYYNSAWLGKITLRVFIRTLGNSVLDMAWYISLTVFLKFSESQETAKSHTVGQGSADTIPT